MALSQTNSPEDSAASFTPELKGAVARLSLGNHSASNVMTGHPDRTVLVVSERGLNALIFRIWKRLKVPLTAMRKS
ncbi:hypothetical protein GQ602_002156 [Ophiocordyceps camponoti-floridani]|uniref:Uncharacterized protein n=1 Tax=Ophiocordyceps camponoti-floridani TaxID=2030778 RepID=A0A8H4Q9X9_9HYPO|nr:hypothetical protein GQ602_002156 [Ophiocordyceps camponoti-floridani]